MTLFMTFVRQHCHQCHGDSKPDEPCNKRPTSPLSVRTTALGTTGGCHSGSVVIGVGSLSTGNLPDETRRQLKAWVLSTFPHALRYASSLLRDRTLADDVVHDCYLRLLQKADVYDLPGDGTKLLYKAITNACIDRNHRERTLLSLSGDSAETGVNPSVMDSRDAGPLQFVIQKELEDAVEEGMAHLPVAQRAALELKSLGYPMQEIADALGTSPSNARLLVHRARKALAECLACYMGSTSDERT